MLLFPCLEKRIFEAKLPVDQKAMLIFDVSKPKLPIKLLSLSKRIIV